MSLSEEAARRAGVASGRGPGHGGGGLMQANGFPMPPHALSPGEKAKAAAASSAIISGPQISHSHSHEGHHPQIALATPRSKSTGRGQKPEGGAPPPLLNVQRNRGVKNFSNGLMSMGIGHSRPLDMSVSGTNAIAAKSNPPHPVPRHNSILDSMLQLHAAHPLAGANNPMYKSPYMKAIGKPVPVGKLYKSPSRRKSSTEHDSIPGVVSAVGFGGGKPPLFQDIPPSQKLGARLSAPEGMAHVSPSFPKRPPSPHRRESQSYTEGPATGCLSGTLSVDAASPHANLNLNLNPNLNDKQEPHLLDSPASGNSHPQALGSSAAQNPNPKAPLGNAQQQGQLSTSVDVPTPKLPDPSKGKDSKEGQETVVQVALEGRVLPDPTSSAFTIDPTPSHATLTNGGISETAPNFAKSEKSTLSHPQSSSAQDQGTDRAGHARSRLDPGILSMHLASLAALEGKEAAQKSDNGADAISGEGEDGSNTQAQSSVEDPEPYEEEVSDAPGGRMAAGGPQGDSLAQGSRPVAIPGSGAEGASRGYTTLAELASKAGAEKGGAATEGGTRPASSSSIAFWGGEPVLNSRPPSQRSKVSRPGTASSLWSNYDLEEGALTRFGSFGSHDGCSSRPESRNFSTPKMSTSAPLRPTSSILHTQQSSSILTGKPPRPKNSASPSGPQPRSLGKKAKQKPKYRPNTWVPHPAVIMDPALLNQAGPGEVVDEIPLDEKGRPYPYVVPPVFPNTYPTIGFKGSAEEMQKSGLHPLMCVKMKIRYAGIANNPVKHAFKMANFRVVNAKAREWNVNWGDPFTPEQYQAMDEFQRAHHFPGTWELGRKDQLYRNMYNAARRVKGDSNFYVVPRFFILPREYEEFRTDFLMNPGRLYIQKPVSSSRGRGIQMVLNPSELPRDTKDMLVQQYIHNPYTVNGYKFDMRIYVAATCFDPLRLYVYPDGITRFAGLKYSNNKSDLAKQCVHLTNYSLNKKNGESQVMPAGLGGPLDENHTAESKWSLEALKNHINAEGKGSWSKVWAQVHDIVAKTILSAEPKISTECKIKLPYRNNCFEVWGFDIMLDENFRAWMIEVNTCPSLAGGSQLDHRVKSNMVADCMHMVGAVPYDKEEYREEGKARRNGRITGLGNKNTTFKGPRTVGDAEQMSFKGWPPECLPDVIAETEAEYLRRGNWERVYPCPIDPYRYNDLFDTPRANNIMVCKYYAEKLSIHDRRTASKKVVEHKEWRPSGGG